MARVQRFLLGAVVLLFLSFPIIGLVLWAATFLLGYTPSFWLALVVLLGMLLNLGVLMGRSVHLSTRSR